VSERGHRVELAPVAQRRLRRLPPGDAARLRGPILALGIEPRTPGAVKLAGTEFWRLRVGDLRVVYLVDDGARLAVVLKVARRSESTYRRVDR
jgi:mRNA interferase RelE/StbE